jgi:hypothetical protein
MAEPATLERVRSRPWFYEFELPDGTRTKSTLPEGVEKIHATRLEMMERALDASVGRDCSALTAVDLACHQGWFALHLARRNFKSILAVDARAEHLADAQLMADVIGVRTLKPLQLDIEDARAGQIGQHDVTLMLGLLYHLENPVRALRLARAVTRRTLLIESQVVPNLSGTVDWGSWRFQRHMVGQLRDHRRERGNPCAGSLGARHLPRAEHPGARMAAEAGRIQARRARAAARRRA